MLDVSSSLHELKEEKAVRLRQAKTSLRDLKAAKTAQLRQAKANLRELKHDKVEKVRQAVDAVARRTLVSGTSSAQDTLASETCPSTSGREAHAHAEADEREMQRILGRNGLFRVSGTFHYLWRPIAAGPRLSSIRCG